MRSAIVTGATSGIGLAAALALGDEDWWVLASGRDEERGAEVARELEGRAGGRFIAADVADVAVPEQLVRAAVDATGRLDLVVYSAGTHFLATVEETEAAAYDLLMATNLRGAVLLAHAAVPAMRAAGGGVIVNVASEAGLVAVAGQVAYNVSKAGLVMLTRSIAVDHARDGIRAVAICPGTTRTPLVERAIAAAADPVAHERWLASSRPANRLGRPEEIAAAIVFAAGDTTPFMTGTEIVVDGGFTAV
jgi:meso-butanediol dehydrogenase/(S,S)-butanediol dehydrogenase/diacetyl reductase